MEHRIREINPQSDIEVGQVAARMRLTLQEVLGEVRGREMYTMDWLIQRVRFHMNSSKCVGQVFLSENDEGFVTGHTIVRLEPDDIGKQIGLFSTIYVEGAFRGKGIAQSLIRRGESWMLEKGMDEAATYTAEDNLPLHRLYSKLGYHQLPVGNGFVKLSKSLTIIG